MKKLNLNVKTSRQTSQNKYRHSRHELTEDGESARAVRHQKRVNKYENDFLYGFDDEAEYQTIRKLLK